MKTALLASAFALIATVASAENPNFGIPADLQANTQPAASDASYGAPSVSLVNLEAGANAGNPAANRFGDGAPYANR